jgi:hypothetical protein
MNDILGLELMEDTRDPEEPDGPGHNRREGAAEEFEDGHLHPKPAVHLVEARLASHDAYVERDADPVTNEGSPHGDQLDITQDREVDGQSGINEQRVQVDVTSELSIQKEMSAPHDSWRVSHHANGTYAPDEAPEEPKYVEKPKPATPENRRAGLGEYVDGFSAAGVFALSEGVVGVEPFVKVCMSWARQADETKRVMSQRMPSALGIAGSWWPPLMLLLEFSETVGSGMIVD